MLGLHAFLDDGFFFFGEAAAVHLSEQVLAPRHADAAMAALKQLGQRACVSITFVRHHVDGNLSHHTVDWNTLVGTKGRRVGFEREA